MKLAFVFPGQGSQQVGMLNDFADVPEIVCDLVDEPDTHLTNLGSKGLGEPPIVPTAAAIGIPMFITSSAARSRVGLGAS